MMDVLIDYLTASVKTRGVFEIMQYMKIDVNETTHRNSFFSRFGMTGCYWFNGVKIHYGKYCILDMSGSGCRTLETLMGDGFDWQEFILWLLTGDGHISRIDIACDDNDDADPKLDMQKMIRHVIDKRYISKARFVTYIGGAEEQVLIGAPASDKRIRIYNKSMERGFGPERHWIRCEIQLRDEKANQFWMHWFFEKIPIGEVFAGTVLETFRFTDEFYDGSNSDRLSVCCWWLDYLENVKRLRNLFYGGLVYNEMNVDRYIRHQAASSLKTFLGINGGDLSSLLEIIDKAKLNDRQKMLLFEKMGRDEYNKGRLEASRQYEQINIGES